MTQSKVGEPVSKFVQKCFGWVEIDSPIGLAVVGEKHRRHVIRIPEPHILDFLLDMYVTSHFTSLRLSYVLIYKMGLISLSQRKFCD